MKAFCVFMCLIVLVFVVPACGKRQTQHMFQACNQGVACPKCKGQGNYRCETCLGRGQYPCTACGQAGQNQCGWCNGTGKAAFGQCTYCAGQGRMTCGTCRGSRFATCQPCTGTGMVKCGVHFTQYRCQQCGATFDYKAKKCTTCGTDL